MDSSPAFVPGSPLGSHHGLVYSGTEWRLGQRTSEGAGSVVIYFRLGASVIFLLGQLKTERQVMRVGSDKL